MQELPFLYKEELFAVHDQFHIEVVQENWGTYLIIDNFWKNPKDINEIAKFIPCTKLMGVYDINDNGSDFFDGRSYFMNHKKWNFQNILENIVSNIFGLKIAEYETDIIEQRTLANNFFNLTIDCFEKNQGKYYAPHTDGTDVIACLSYLNSDYDQNDGTAIFPRGGITKSLSPWMDLISPIGFLPAKFNRMIIYDGTIPHASTISRRWTTETRHSMVYFMKVYK